MKLIALEGEENDYFAYSVAVHTGTVVVGSKSGVLIVCVMGQATRNALFMGKNPHPEFVSAFVA